MRKFLLLGLIAALMISGCGSDNTVKVGTIKYLNVTEEVLDNYSVGVATKHAPYRKHIFFDNMTLMIAALESGQVDEISIYQTVASYLKNNNPEYHWDISKPIVPDMFCCAMRAEDVELREEFDDAILTISKDGTLAKLVKKYISDFSNSVSPESVDLPTFYDAPTIRIAVTGDMPPLDLVKADGKPAGFNTAVLAEISNIIKKNFVLVQVDSGARAAALSSKQVDVIFWAVASKLDAPKIPKNFDTPDGVILTIPYFTDEIVHVKLIK